MANDIGRRGFGLMMLFTGQAANGHLLMVLAMTPSLGGSA